MTTEVGSGEVDARFVWVQDRSGRQLRVLLAAAGVQQGEVRVDPAEVDGDAPPPGRYMRIREDLEEAVSPRDPIPVLLHEAYEAAEESSISPLADLQQEAQVVDQVKVRVQEAVELAMQRGAVPIGPTYTRGLTTPAGPIIHGMCVLAWPRT